MLYISRFVQSWPSFNLCTRYIITSALIIDCTIHCASLVPHLAQVVLPAHNFFPFPPHRVQPPLPRAKGERARRGKPRIPRLRYLLMPLWLKKKAWNFLVTSGRERGRGRRSCDVATPEDFLIKNGRERLRKHSTSTAIVSDDLSARRAKRKGGGGKRGRRRRKNGGRKIQVENTGDVVFFGHHQPRPRGEITRQNRKNGDGTTEISLRQPTLSCICGREGREWERGVGRQAFVLQRVCLVSIRFLISFFLFSIFSFFFFWSNYREPWRGRAFPTFPPAGRWMELTCFVNVVTGNGLFELMAALLSCLQSISSFSIFSPFSSLFFFF